jgi:hypothetical protein
MTDIDLNYWGLVVVPIGLAICFFPALGIWLVQEMKAGPEDDDTRGHRA